jgi:hypothetical protein
MPFLVQVTGVLAMMPVASSICRGQGFRRQRGDPKHPDPSLLGSQATGIEQKCRQGFQRTGGQAKAKDFSIFVIVIPGQQQTLATTPPEGHALLLDECQDIFSRLEGIPASVEQAAA